MHKSCVSVSHPRVSSKPNHHGGNVLFDLDIVGRTGSHSHLSVYIYNNLNDVSRIIIACHSYVCFCTHAMGIKVCEWIPFLLFPLCFTEKIPFIGIHALLLMHWTRGIGHVLLWSTRTWLAAPGMLPYLASLRALNRCRPHLMFTFCKKIYMKFLL